MNTIPAVSILLVDDEPAIRSLMGMALADAGYRVLQASNGNEALQVFDEQGQDIALVITDMRMPYVGGAELLAELRARSRTLKCLGMSGYALATELTVPLLKKPFSRGELLGKVRSILAAGPDQPSV